jgi:hypothetical protein
VNERRHAQIGRDTRSSVPEQINHLPVWGAIFAISPYHDDLPNHDDLPITPNQRRWKFCF